MYQQIQECIPFFQHGNNDGEDKESNRLDEDMVDDYGIRMKKITYTTQMKSVIEFVIGALLRYSNERYDIECEAPSLIQEDMDDVLSMDALKHMNTMDKNSIWHLMLYAVHSY